MNIEDEELIKAVKKLQTKKGFETSQVFMQKALDNAKRQNVSFNLSDLNFKLLYLEVAYCFKEEDRYYKMIEGEINEIKEHEFWQWVFHACIV